MLQNTVHGSTAVGGWVLGSFSEQGYPEESEGYVMMVMRR